MSVHVSSTSLWDRLKELLNACAFASIGKGLGMPSPENWHLIWTVGSHIVFDVIVLLSQF